MIHSVTAKFRYTFPAMALLAVSCVSGEPALDHAEIADHAYPGLVELSETGRYIVTFKNEAGRTAMTAAGGTIIRDLARHNAVAVHLPEAAVVALRQNPNIEFVEVDYIREPLAETVPYGIPMVQADQVPATPPSGDSGRIRLCIIDSGLAAGHEEFAGLPVSGTNNGGTGNWNEDTCGHGTHVAGTVAAVAGNGVGVVGVAPGAVELHIVKVFDGAGCLWTYSSTLVAALDTCVDADAQVVSMSLGGGLKSRFEERAFASAYSSGVLSVAAAGNDGSAGYSYPASYDSVISVAALDASKAVASFSQYNAQVELAAPGVGVLSTYPYDVSLTVDATKYNGHGIEHAAPGNASGALVDGGRCATTGAWSGKVVLCERGDIAFYNKVMNVQNSGGLAAVIYNNVSGNFFGTLGDGNSSDIPAISLSQEDGQTLLAGSLGQVGEIVSGQYGNGYASFEGTSMATPHVSAAAALIWAQVPSATAGDVRTAMSRTAEDLGAMGRDDYYGNGLVQAKLALDYLLSGDGGTCSAPGTACSSNSDCCSGSCAGRGKKKRICK